MTLKREIKDAYIEGGNSIYVKTHSNAIYVDENETETLTQRLDNLNGKIDNNNTTQLNNIANINTKVKDVTTQLKENVNEINNIKSDFAKKADVNDLASNKADKNELQNTNNELNIQKARIDSFTSLPAGSTTGDGELIDGRIGIDGETYSNIGEAIRSQIKQTNNYIDDIKTDLACRNAEFWEQGSFNSDGTKVDSEWTIRYINSIAVDESGIYKVILRENLYKAKVIVFDNTNNVKYYNNEWSSDNYNLYLAKGDTLSFYINRVDGQKLTVSQADFSKVAIVLIKEYNEKIFGYGTLGSDNTSYVASGVRMVTDFIKIEPNYLYSFD